MTQTEQAPWAGFWPRVGALLVDSLVIGAAGALLGAAAFDALAALGETGRLIGLAMSILYFGALQSRLGGGQTLGMKLFRLQVRALNGDLLNVGPACLRALVLILPFMLNGISLKTSGITMVFGVVALSAVFGLSLAQLYLLIFNRPSRRLLHDFVAGSVVVKAGGEPLVVSAARKHRIGAIVCLVLPLPVLALAAALPKPGFAKRLLPPATAVQALPEVMTAQTTETQSTAWINGTSVKSQAMVVAARLRAWPSNPDTEAARIAAVVLRTYGLQSGQDLRVNLNYGYSIGVASSWRTKSVVFPAGSAQAPPPNMRPAAAT